MSRAKSIRIRIVECAKRAHVLRAAWSVWRRFTRPSHSVCESILEWALTTPDASVERVCPASTVHRQPPNTLDATVHEFFASFPPSYLVPEKYIARVPGGRIVASEGLLVLPDGSFSVEGIYERRHLLEVPSFRKRLPRNETFYPGNYFSLLIKFVTDSNYYHWLHDGVLRLHEVIERLPADTRFVVPARRRPFQDEALALVGVSPDRLCELGDGGVARFENLYFAPPSAPSGVDSTEADVWFRERALSAYGIALGPPSRRIYISRRGASYRRITNESEVEALLRDLGFEIHELEQYSLHDQVALFRGGRSRGLGPWGGPDQYALFPTWPCRRGHLRVDPVQQVILEHEHRARSSLLAPHRRHGAEWNDFCGRYPCAAWRLQGRGLRRHGWLTVLNGISSGKLGVKPDRAGPAAPVMSALTRRG
jgi:capsular polysaccharide biosynthesis protein